MSFQVKEQREKAERGKDGVCPRKSRKWIVGRDMVPGDSKHTLRATVVSEPPPPSSSLSFILYIELLHTISFEETGQLIYIFRLQHQRVGKVLRRKGMVG